MTDPAFKTKRWSAAEPVQVIRHGEIAYDTAWQWQRQVAAARAADEGSDTLFLLQHPRVFTLGRRANRENILLSEQELAAQGITVVAVDRGGDVTYHGPGQLVGYPILRLASLRGVAGYIRSLEEVLIQTLDAFNVVGVRIAGRTGVWVNGSKIAAIGVRVASRGVTTHGFALNVTNDPDDFRGIVPCGIHDADVCSLKTLGVTTTLDAVCDQLEVAFADVFDATLEPVSLNTALAR
jgi:lipoyl(octanoyl) transferase